MARHGDTTPFDPYRVVAQLNGEWSTLTDELGEVRGWGGRHPALRCCSDVHDLLSAVADDPDGVLGALLWEVVAGSTLAARVVLQAMLGKVVLLGRTDPDTGLQAYLVAMWERIRTYPIDRRPQHIAANLALDARKLARREGRGLASVTPWPPGASFAELVDRQRRADTEDHNRDVSLLTAGDVIRAALELELIDADAGELLDTVYGEGLSSSEAAHRHSMSPQMVRQRCSRVVRQLAGHAHELATFA